MGCGPCVKQRPVKSSIRYVGPLLADSQRALFFNSAKTFRATLAGIA